MPVNYATLQRLIQPLPAAGYDILTCPRCTYDVKQTLLDGFDICPECGTTISVSNCKPRPWDDSPWALAFMFAIFLLPAGFLIAGSVAGPPLLLMIAPSLMFPVWTAPLWSLALAYVVVLFAYRYARNRMGEHPSWPRSALDALGVLVLNAALALVLLPILLLFV